MITIDGFDVKFWTFPAGERGVKIEKQVFETGNWFNVRCAFTGSDDLIDLMMLKDALDNVNFEKKQVRLFLGYMPYARQDRRVDYGEAHSMRVVSRLINSCKFDEVLVDDPHSDVVEALIDNLCIYEQYQAANKVLGGLVQDAILVAPDAGAAKKIYKFAALRNNAVIVAQKERNLTNGKIIRSYIGETEHAMIQNRDVWIIDDICDGGASFIELSKALTGAKTLNLYTTHGIYSKGKQVLTDIFDEVLCYNDMSNEKEAA